MRILYFTRACTGHDRRFLAKLAETPHETWLLMLDQEPGSISPALPDGVRVAGWPSSHPPLGDPADALGRMADFRRILDRVEPDLIHAGPVQTAGFVAALSGHHPFLLMSWGSDLLVDADRDDRWRWVSRFTLSQADWFLSDCDAVRARAKDLVPGYRDDRVVQFPWGIDLARFRPGRPGPLVPRAPGREGAVVVLSTRSWEPIYGIDVVLRGFALAHGDNPALRLVLLGGGSLEPVVRALIDELGLRDVVATPGAVAHDLLPEYFRAADVFVSASYSDGSSISLLEALATGLPAVVTDIPGNREWVTAGVNGWLASPGSPESFAEGLLRASTLGAGERERIGSANRVVALARADWDANAGRLLRAYEAIEALLPDAVAGPRCVRPERGVP